MPAKLWSHKRRPNQIVNRRSTYSTAYGIARWWPCLTISRTIYCEWKLFLPPNNMYFNRLILFTLIFRHLFENFNDSFRNIWMHHPTQFSCTPSNNIYAKLLQSRFKQTIISARGGGIIEATKRLLSQLPISAQSYSNSPYLDLSLFSYDDKWVSMLERPKGMRS